ncbi:MAG: AIPR family protein [Gemmatimonadales bacterium]|nr:AIPR family protein [Gemmatimonadales bacterium]
MEIRDFAQELLQDVLAEADADGEFREDVFFDKACVHLQEAGELDTADRVPYRSPSRGIRVDGYGGDPRDASGTLSLVVLDFHAHPTPGRLIGSEMDAIFRRLSKFVLQALDQRWRDALEETSPAFGLADLIHHCWSSLGKIRFFLVSNRELSERVDGRPAGELEGKPVTYSVWDLRRLHRAAANPEPEAIELDLVKDFGGALPILPAQQLDGDHESYLAALPGPVLSEIYDRWGARLLEQNVRVFLQARSKVNRGIRDTLAHEPEMFFAYNNGITATAESVEIRSDGKRLLLCGLRNFQIVNGGQTTASIHAATRKKVDISQTFVQMKLSVVNADRAVKLVPKISEYANSQNRVAASDFFSNHPFHVRVEAFSRRIYAPSPDGTFQQSKWFYERARGQFADARGGRTTAERRKFDIEYPRRQRFNKTDLAKFLSVWEGLPHVVSLGAQKNFAAFASRVGKAWNKNADDFNEAWYREAIAKALVFRATERIVSAQPWYQGGFRANIVAYTIARISRHVEKTKRSVDFEAIWRRQAPGPILRETVAVVAERVHDVLVDPPEGMRNVTEWAKKQACWSRAEAIRIKWPARLGDELMSMEDRKKAAQDAQVDQRVLNGIEAQMAIVNAGGEFWANALDWGREHGLLSPTEIGVLGVASNVPRQLPTEKQSLRVIQALEKLQANRYREKLPPHQE